MKKLITFEIAKLLKGKGFDKSGYLQNVWLGNRYEGKYPKVKEIPVFGLGATSVLPTIAEVVMWLYEKHGIWISVLQHTKNGKGIYFESVANSMTFSGYDSPTKAYEAAIEYILKNLI